MPCSYFYLILGTFALDISYEFLDTLLLIYNGRVRKRNIGVNKFDRFYLAPVDNEKSLLRNNLTGPLVGLTWLSFLRSTTQWRTMPDLVAGTAVRAALLFSSVYEHRAPLLRVLRPVWFHDGAWCMAYSLCRNLNVIDKPQVHDAAVFGSVRSGGVAKPEFLEVYSDS